jgi:hypothetical protein
MMGMSMKAYGAIINYSPADISSPSFSLVVNPEFAEGSQNPSSLLSAKRRLETVILSERVSNRPV